MQPEPEAEAEAEAAKERLDPMIGDVVHGPVLSAAAGGGPTRAHRLTRVAGR